MTDNPITDTLAALDRQRVEDARRDHPEHEWLLTEPTDKRPVIDAEGFAWKHEWDGEDEWDRDNPQAWSWRRQVVQVTANAKYLIGPSMGDEWEEVLDYGPIRTATPTDDLRCKFLVYPEGWADGAPQGKPVVFDSVVDALDAVERGFR